MSPLEALLPDDLEKHVQLNRARLNSYGVLREEINTYCECGGHAKRKGSSHPGGDDPMDIDAFVKGKGKQSTKGSTKRATAEGSKDSKDDKDETGVRTRTRTRIRLNVGTVESADTNRKIVGARRTPTKVVRKESRNPRMQRMLTILTRRNQQMLNQKLKSVNSRWVFSMLMHFNSKILNGSRLESTQVQERRQGPRVSHTGRRFLAMLTSLSAQQLESLSSLVSDCTLKVATIGESISEFEVFKRRCVNHRCLLEKNTRRWVESLSCMVTKVACSTMVRECCEENRCMDPEGDERLMTIMMMKVTVTMMIIMSRMMTMMMHALRSFSEDTIIQRHGGLVARFGVNWLPWPDDLARGTEAWGVGLSVGWLGWVLGCLVVGLCVGWFGSSTQKNKKHKTKKNKKHEKTKTRKTEKKTGKKGRHERKEK